MRLRLMPKIDDEKMLFYEVVLDTATAKLHVAAE